jgi:hypothetical protein
MKGSFTEDVPARQRQPEQATGTAGRLRRAIPVQEGRTGAPQAAVAENDPARTSERLASERLNPRRGRPSVARGVSPGEGMQPTPPSPGGAAAFVAGRPLSPLPGLGICCPPDRGSCPGLHAVALRGRAVSRVRTSRSELERLDLGRLRVVLRQNESFWAGTTQFGTAPGRAASARPVPFRPAHSTCAPVPSSLSFLRTPARWDYRESIIPRLTDH